MDDYTCYIIENKRSTYVGITNNLKKRLRQHNSEITGGARYTKMKGPGWNYVCLIHNLDKISAMQLEWAIKHEKPIQASGIFNRIKKLTNILNKDKFTSKAKLITEFNLYVEWFGTCLDSENNNCVELLSQNLNNLNIENNLHDLHC